MIDSKLHKQKNIMKTKLFNHFFFIILGTLMISSCTQVNENLAEKKQHENNISSKARFAEAQNIIFSSHKSEEKIHDYLTQDWGVCLSGKTRSVSVNQDLLQKYLEENNITDEELQKYLEENNITEEELQKYLEENPFELTSFVQAVTSNEFSMYYESMHSTPNIESMIEEIYLNDKLTSTENPCSFY